MKELMGKSAGAYPQVIASGGRSAAGTVPVPAGARTRAKKIIDAEGIEQALELAALTLLPDEVSGRGLVKRLMPHLYKLRKRGFSFLQVTRVINDAIGETNAKLPPGTVKAYYNEFIEERRDECVEQLTAAEQLMAEIRKMTAKSPQQLVAEGAELKTAISASRGAGAMARMRDGQIVSTVGSVDAAPVIPAAPNVVAAPVVPVISAKSQELAPAMFAEPMGNFGDLVVPDLPGSAVSPIEVVPVASVPPKPVAATSRVAVGSAPAAVLPGGGGAAILCVTVPTPETTHPPTADILSSNPQAFFSDAVLEHPDVPGLMLTRDQRLHTMRLEYTVNGGAERESVKQMVNRYKWRSVPKATPSRTEKDFVQMDTSLFTNNS